MQNFTEKIVSMMKSEQLFEGQGGPIILSQVCSYSSFSVCREFAHRNPSISFIYNLFLIFSDWEWIRAIGVGSRGTSKGLCKLGSANGSQPQHRGSVDHVQGRWCSWSSCTFATSFLHIWDSLRTHWCNFNLFMLLIWGPTSHGWVSHVSLDLFLLCF